MIETEIRAGDVEAGQAVREDSAESWLIVIEVHWHGDTVVVTNGDEERTFDRDTVVMMRPATWQLPIPGFGDITAYLSPNDGALVVEIDTPEATHDNGNADFDSRPKIRVYVNDDAVWENPPLTPR